MQLTQAQLVRDQSGAPIQEGSSFQTTDGSASPVSSPITLSSGVNIITVPLGGMEFDVYPVSNDLKISEISSVASYDLVTKGNKEAYPCARMSKIYLEGTAGDTVYFRFIIV